MKPGAERVVDILHEAGVEVVFGIPSIHNIRLYEALRKRPSIRHILCRQEAGAAHMADGYARAAGRPGVVVTSTGPGAGYTVPALLEALGSLSPVVMITTNIKSSKIGKGIGTLHELDRQDRIFQGITKETFVARSPEDVVPKTRQALRAALSGRPGPVYLELPTDLLDRQVPGGEHGPDTDSLFAPPGDASELARAVDLLNSSSRPVLLVGTGAVRAGMAREVKALAEELAAPVITTVPAKGILPEDHPLAFGNAARRGAVRRMIQSADVVLALGTRLREVDTKRRGITLPRLIHVDWDEQWIGRNFPPHVALTGDIVALARSLLGGVAEGGGGRAGWAEAFGRESAQEQEEIRRLREVSYLDALRAAIPRDGVLVADNTILGYWAEYFYPSHFPGGLVPAKGSAVIGFAFAAAAGVKLALPERPVAALIGDGGFLYSAQELATCVRHGIGFPVVVVNDGAYGIIGQLQEGAYGTAFESDLVNPDFCALARAFGVSSVRVESPDELGREVRESIASGEVRLVELRATFPASPFARY
ncbi:MAG: thiamine pyrophosphate-binding protein [Deltaproteobacteria bacterium]|nr:thiamine pyrophosphate-binding protein [Deltaproteobacteria bacterium]